MTRPNLCKYAFNIKCLGVWNNPLCTGGFILCEEYNKLQEEEIKKYLEQKRKTTPLMEYNIDTEEWEEGE